MSTLPSPFNSLCLILAIALVSLPAISFAGDPDPDGVKLMLLHEDPEFKADLKEKLGSAEYSTDWGVVCAAEMLTLVGAIVWEARKEKDQCKRFRSSEYGAGDYCLYFSDNCDHYKWDSNCLLDVYGADYCAKR